MKCVYKNFGLFFLFTCLILCLEIEIIYSTMTISKSFSEIATEEVFKKEEYESEVYRKEAASLNPEYYTPKGSEELAKCRDMFNANYDRCTRFKTCNFCAANSDCGWCNEKKICIPVEPDTRNDMIVPVCQGDCIRVLRIEYCYKGLFEPENTQGEINFANYPQVLKEQIKEGSNSSDTYEEESDNIFEKALEKNFYEQRAINNKLAKKVNNNDSYRNYPKNAINSNSLSKDNPIYNSDSNISNASNASNVQNDNSFSFKQIDINSAKDPNFKDKNKLDVNDSRLNYNPDAYTNKPLSVDLNTHGQRLYKDLTNVSKGIFSQLIGEKLKPAKKINLLNVRPNLQNNNKDDMNIMKDLKEYVPNFEFPQFLKSDLEGSIDQINKQKLLLWLRGYSLNEPISKQHFPIYKNLNFVNEDQTRKMVLDKFYKSIVKDPYKNVNSKVYKNMIGEQTLSGEDIISNIKGRNDKIKLSNVKGKTVYRKSEDSNSAIEIDNTNKEDEKGLTNNPLESAMSINVINSQYIEKSSLKEMIKQNNMRFKENVGKSNNLNKQTKSFMQISKELKDFLKKN